MPKVTKKETSFRYWASFVGETQYPCSKTRSGKLRIKQKTNLFRTGSTYGCKVGCPHIIKQCANLDSPKEGLFTNIFGNKQSEIIKIVGEIKPGDDNILFGGYPFSKFEEIK